MKTLLIVMVLVGRNWTPQYAVEHRTEISCTQAAAKYPESWNATIKAICVPILKEQVKG